MTTLCDHIKVRCPNCQTIIERVTTETMVYCIRCRKWCREMETVKSVPTIAPPRVPKRRRYRCH